ncbi:TonB-dependent receptor domain-containing protein [Chitinimonas sp. BJB300]|uniref:TonB-dependent receptor domain-containing protein n=1 Tax=Chitinimonas sp. BJB300 TaxID=1559339 RepID=UPI000C0C9AE1|nr:TonB-dependent receptor [Chitinimonas sp. BJB300]PHV12576.1 TonB-dependent receptor [Chitinimonas sp. BJB300]TSJ90030.1 TonB-dependent receptor [Chitinimonas sp. BJB300]
MRIKQLAYAIGMIGVGSIGFASAADEVQKAEKIEITGSSIKRIVKEGALPVQTLKREDITRTGATSVAELMQAMPAMQGFTAASDSVGGGGGGLVTASLHNIGEKYTLVLLNGRRIAPADSGGTVNLASIPLSAVERVEILTDGASALYGSDAIAGVVNFILKKNQQGVDLEARYTNPQHPGGKNWSASVTAGFGDLATDGFNAMVSYSHESQDLLRAKDRDISKTGIIPFGNNGQSLLFFNGSPRSIPGNVDVNYKDASGADQTFSFNPYYKANQACPADHQRVDSTPGQYYCYFDYASTVQIMPESARDSVFATGRLKVGDGWTLFSDVAVSKYEMKTRIAAQTANVPITIDASNGTLYSTYILPYLPADATAAGATVVDAAAAYRVLDLGGRASKYSNESKHIVLGAEGDLGSWSLKGSGTIAENTLSEDRIGGYVLQQPFVAAVQSGQVNPFVGPGQQTAAAMDLLNKALYFGPLSKDKVKYKGIEGSGSTELMELAGGQAMIAVGGDFRDYAFITTRDPASNGNILNELAQPNYDLTRQSMGVFGEVALPVLDSLELNVSTRYDKIDSVKDKLAGVNVGSSNAKATYKISGRYQPTKSTLLRASYGTGFRAPSMLDIARPLSDFGVSAGTYTCPNFPAGDILGTYCKVGKQQAEVFKQGEATLKPEKSEQWSVGFRIEPSSSFGFGMDMWDVSITDAVREIDESVIFDDPVTYHDRFTYKTNTATGRKDLAIILKAENIGKLHNRGIDWDTVGRFKVMSARVTTNLTGTYLLKSEYTKPGSQAYESSLGQYGSDDKVAFRTLANLATTVELGNWANTVAIKYKSGYKDKTYSVADCSVTKPDLVTCMPYEGTVSSYTTVDFQARYTVKKGFMITGGISNLFDRDPPRSLRNTGSHQLGYDPRYADALGRAYYVSGNYKF